MSADQEPWDDEREWQSQERAMRASPEGPGAEVDADYRLVADALRSLPCSEPPEGFAAAVIAEIVRRRAVPQHRPEHRVVSLAAIACAFGIGAAALFYAGQAWRSLPTVFAEGLREWGLLALGCGLLSWLCGEQVRRAGASAGRRRATR